MTTVKRSIVQSSTFNSKKLLLHLFRKLKCRTATNGVQIRELRNHPDILIKCRFWFVQCRRGCDTYIAPGSHCCCWCADHTLNGRDLEDTSFSSLLQGPAVQSLLPILGLSSWPSYVGGKIQAMSREIPQALPSSLPTYQPSSPQHPQFPLMTSDHPCSHDWKHTRMDFYITPTILPLFLWLSIHMLN